MRRLHVSSWSHTALAASLGFLLACTGGAEMMSASTVAPAPPPAPAPPQPAPAAPTPDAVPPVPGGEEPALAVPATDAGLEPPAPDSQTKPVEGPPGEYWCCQYEGPLGKTQAMANDPGACARLYADHQPEFIRDPVCAPVCCKYPNDPADLARGYEWDEVTAGNCTQRKGTVAEKLDNMWCRDPNKPVPHGKLRVMTPKPVPPAPPRPRNPLNPKSPRNR